MHGNHTSCQRKDESVFSDPTYNVSVLFGKRDEPLLLACARQLIEHISGSGSARSLMISLGLKDHSQATMKYIVSTIIENRLW
ncbi:Os10g0395500 [Oryza sativa Japonica Group]|uniref:Os10g0395500 protein n=1 Tax=Oryza sativa subsp. japonica TaxID=39947 RepID=Q0IXV5_ORYSJ|nr:Os10g0395500 [Oryza sativa Japonica Group]|eukprot:NP_001064529.2 Os10g0395500 [Oryza sativa Japonica Group]